MLGAEGEACPSWCELINHIRLSFAFQRSELNDTFRRHEERKVMSNERTGSSRQGASFAFPVELCLARPQSRRQRLTRLTRLSFRPIRDAIDFRT